jgi:LuxR family maltose regulon positive regulatory protein
MLPALAGSPAYYFGLSDLLRERNDLAGAHRLLMQGMELVQGTVTVDAYVITLGYIALARLQQAQGNFQSALTTLHAFTELAHQRHLAQHLLAQAAAVQAQVEVAHGNLAAAERWLKESGLSVDDEELSYPREREYLSLARVRIAQGRADPEDPFLPEALQMLARLLHDAERNARGAVSSRYSSCKPSPCRHKDSRSTRWLFFSEYWPWLNRRATCASSSMRAPRCSLCCAWPMRKV